MPVYEVWTTVYERRVYVIEGESSGAVRDLFDDGHGSFEQEPVDGYGHEVTEEIVTINEVVPE